jgi:murein L,D-transpeptidase YafK
MNSLYWLQVAGCLLLSACQAQTDFKKISRSMSDSSDRVADARSRIGEKLADDLAQKGLKMGMPVFLRGFKSEAQLELWMQKEQEWVLFRTYPICRVPGKLGPKRKEGDLQVPEGLYEIDVFNPKSSYHLSMRVNYPNAADLHFADPDHPGGEIYIHGACVSVGCLPLTDEKIEEVYLLTLYAHEQGQKNAPVHLFPCRMKPKNTNWLYLQEPNNRAFWENLQTAYDYWEKEQQVPKVKVNTAGFYVLEE